MESKNFLFITALTICGLVSVHNVQAQSDPVNTVGVNVTIDLKQVASIKVNPGTEDVLLSYDTKDDYLNGVSVKKDNHLEVFCTSAFEVFVDDVNSFVSTSNNIAANTVEVTPSLNVGTVPSSMNLYTKSLGVKTPIITSSDGIKTLNFDVTYTGAKDDTYTNIPFGSYNSTVTYSIVAK